jgi:formylmethanofuran dehydrogenase subunit D
MEKAVKTDKITLAPMTGASVVVVATAKNSSLKEGKEYTVSGIHANTLIKKGFAKLKNV